MKDKKQQNAPAPLVILKARMKAKVVRWSLSFEEAMGPCLWQKISPL
jgi:hypothetical protein